MTYYVPAGTAPLVAGALARIERRLPQPGEVLVRVGQRVEPEDPVARAYLSGPPVIINMARALSIPPSQVPRAMRREHGNKVAEGEVLARSSRLGGCSFVAPASGVIAAVDQETGYVTLSPDPVEFELQATVRGLVMDVIPGIGVRIETPAAQVYGIFGFGRERAGVLRLLVTDPSEPILPEMVDARSAYAILIGGSSITAAGLRRAAAEQVRGVIVGGIDEAELRQFFGWSSLDGWRVGHGGWQVPAAALGGEHDLTLVVTEGFGARPMSAPLFDLLAEHDRQEALIAGMTQLRQPQERPRVVIPLSARSANVQLEAPRPVLSPGGKVRLLDAAHLGDIGLVRLIPSQPRRLPSGARAPAVEVALEDGSSLTLPRNAVEPLA
jgi:hypothetical protein